MNCLHLQVGNFPQRTHDNFSFRNESWTVQIIRTHTEAVTELINSHIPVWSSGKKNALWLLVIYYPNLSANLHEIILLDSTDSFMITVFALFSVQCAFNIALKMLCKIASQLVHSENKSCLPQTAVIALYSFRGHAQPIDWVIAKMNQMRHKNYI